MQDSASSVWSFLNNGSIAAFLGAFFAFLLVAFTDWRRNRARLKTLLAQVNANARVIEPMLEAITNSNFSLILKTIKPTGARGFRVSDMVTLKCELLDLIEEKQLLCLESILHQMQGMNDQLDQELDLAKKMYEKQDAEDALKTFATVSDALGRLYENMGASLFRLQDIVALFNKKQYDDIINAKHSREAYVQRAQERFTKKA